MRLIPWTRVLTIRYWHSLTMSKVDALHRDEIPPGTLYLLIFENAGALRRNAWVRDRQFDSADIERRPPSRRRLLVPRVAPRMLIKGWATAGSGATTAGNRRARYYQLTAAGRKQLEVEVSQL